MNKYEGLYCPFCLGELDKTGCCWISCEYEAEGALPKYRPLTRLRRARILYSNAEINLKAAKREVIKYSKLLKELQPRRAKSKWDRKHHDSGELS